MIRVSDAIRTTKDYASLGDAFSRTQYDSKLWLIEELEKISYSQQKKISIIGGWYGAYLVPFLKKSLNPKQIYFSDLDRGALKIAKILNGEENISYHCFDAIKDSKKIYEGYPDIVINTSCEHMANMIEIVNNKNDILYVFQSCDYAGDPGHINPAISLDDFIHSSGLTKLLYYGTKDLGHKKRFMIIGTA